MTILLSLCSYNFATRETKILGSSNDFSNLSEVQKQRRFHRLQLRPGSLLLAPSLIFQLSNVVVIGGDTATCFRLGRLQEEGALDLASSSKPQLLGNRLEDLASHSNRHLEDLVRSPRVAACLEEEVVDLEALDKHSKHREDSEVSDKALLALAALASLPPVRPVSEALGSHPVGLEPLDLVRLNNPDLV